MVENVPRPAPCATAAKITWQEAAERMERLRKQGEAFSTQGTLADNFGCSTSTINKAINKTPSLQAWAKPEGTAPPRAQSLIGVVTDNVAQSRDPNPEDDAAIREFIEQADAETKAWFLALSTDKQLAIVNDPDKHPKILGRKA
jgi:hypothetical protein